MLSKREALAMGYRRWLIRSRAAEAKELPKAAAKEEAKYQRRLKRREGTVALAMERIEACEKYPTPVAVFRRSGKSDCDHAL